MRRPRNVSVIPGRGIVPTVRNGLNVSPCGYISLGLRPVVVVPGVLVSWCTVWKGTSQDCMDHVRGAHDVPWDIKSASLEKFVPPWTGQCQVWPDSLKTNHSGISTDVLL